MVKDNYDSGRNRLGSDENSGNNMQAFDPAEGLMPMSTQGNQVARSQPVIVSRPSGAFRRR